VLEPDRLGNLKIDEHDEVKVPRDARKADPSRKPSGS
jgi:hypothetical protein